MPVYFFDTQDEVVINEDRHGHEFRMMGLPQREAIRSMSELARNYVPEMGPPKTLVVVARRGSGVVMEVVMTMTVSPL